LTDDFIDGRTDMATVAMLSTTASDKTLLHYFADQVPCQLLAQSDCQLPLKTYFEVLESVNNRMQADAKSWA
jgi:hypothetical protein